MAEDHEVDISETQVVQDARDPDHAWLGHGYRQLPFDLPADVHVTRHLKADGDGVKHLVGWSIRIPVACRGEVTIKVAHSGGMEVWVDGERVSKKPFTPNE